jgi:hypothetical protein
VNDWTSHFDDRERRLINNCVDYATSDPAGLPAHNIMIIVAKMVKLLNQQAGENAENIRQPAPTPRALY